MSRGRANPGRHVGAGSLRVDAARAVQKLRDYQLPEPAMWILELLRAAVLLGADGIRVDGDADDVRITWGGPAPEVDDLTQLLDELVNPVSVAERRHLRLMATAVNTALGLAPRYLDIFVCHGDVAERVRFTPSILEVDEDDPLAGAPGLRALSASTVDRPLGAPAEGVLVHLRRTPSLGMLGTLLTGREPPELRLVRECCDDSRVPISVGGAVLIRDRSQRDILRVPLGPSVSGFMALLRVDSIPRQARPALLEASEVGVLLASHAITLPLRALAAVPLRVSVDADRLPTNASRSAVRRDEAPIAEAEARAKEALESLVECLVRELGPDPERDWTEGERRELLRSTFLLIASSVALGDFRVQIPALLEGPLEGLADLPLLRDAFGDETTLRRVGSAPRRGPFVHRGDVPLPKELKPWLVDMLWAPAGDPVELLLDGDVITSPSARIADARESLAALEGYLLHPVHSGHMPNEAPPWLAVPLSDLTGPATGLNVDGALDHVSVLDGQLSLVGGSAGGLVSYLHQGRLLAQRRVHSRLSFEAVVSSELITPNDDFTELFNDHGADEVARAVVGAAIRAVEELARRLLGEPGAPCVEAQAPWLKSREALAAQIDARAMIRWAVTEYTEVFGASRLIGPLRRAPVWPLVNVSGDAEWASLDELISAVGDGDDTLFVADVRAARRVSPGAPPGRRIVAALSEEERALASLCPDATVVRYRPFDLVTARGASAMAEQLARLAGSALPFERDSGFGAIALWDAPYGLDVYHVGRRLERRTLEGKGAGYWVLYESPRLVPQPDFLGVRSGRVPRSFQQEERALLRAAVRRMLGDDVSDYQCSPDEPLERPPRVLPVLLMQLAHLGADGLDGALGAQLAKRFRALSLWPVFGRDELASLDDLASFHPGALCWVSPEETSDLDLGDFHPLRASEEHAGAVARLLNKDLRDGTRQFRRRHNKAFRRLRAKAHRQKDVWVAPRASEGALSVDVPDTSRIPRVQLSLLGGEAAGAMVVLIEDRFFATVMPHHQMPVRATVRLRLTAADAFFAELTDKARDDALALVATAIPKLLAAVAEEDPEMLSADPNARRLLDWWRANPLVSAEDGQGAPELPEALGRAPLFMSIQGDRAGAVDALRRTRVYVAAYVGMWLSPDEGEAPHGLDQAVLHVAEGPGSANQLQLIQRLAGHEILDVTLPVARLQARRRVAQGLVPKPTVHHFPGVDHVHDISALVGTDRGLRQALGPGQVGLLNAPRSQVLVFREGVRVGSMELDTVPAIVVALEEANLGKKLKKLKKLKKQRKAPIFQRVQELADRLVYRLVDEGAVEALSAHQKRGMASAMLTGAVLAGHEGAADVPLFETTGDDWISLAAVQHQQQRFGDVWFTVDLLSAHLPLDPLRHALRLSGKDAALLGAGYTPIDAAAELALDAEARRHQGRAKLEALELRFGEDSWVLTEEALVDADGPAVEGLVAPLFPWEGVRAELRLSRQRHPLGEHPDPCDWPTLAIVDGPGIVPNRTWSGANEDDASFVGLVEAVRAASERALQASVPIPPHPFAAQRIGSAECAAAKVKVAVRGALWVLPTDEVLGEAKVQVVESSGVRELNSNAGAARLPLHGILYVDGPTRTGAAEAVAWAAYRAMVREMAGRLTEGWDPLCAAHVIHGLALGLVHPAELDGSQRWPLGTPDPIDLAVVGRWLSGAAGTVWVVTPDQLEPMQTAFASAPGGPSEDHPWFVNDGSVAARMMLRHLASRVRCWVPAVPVLEESFSGGASPAVPFSALPPPLPAPLASVSAPKRGPNPTGIENRLHQRLLEAGIHREVLLSRRRRRRLVHFTRSYPETVPTVELTVKHPLIVALMEALASKDPRAEAALDVLAARVIGEHTRLHGLPPGRELGALTALLESRVGPLGPKSPEKTA